MTENKTIPGDARHLTKITDAEGLDLDTWRGMQLRIVEEAKERGATPAKLLRLWEISDMLGVVLNIVEDLVTECEQLELIAGFGVGGGVIDLEGGNMGAEYIAPATEEE